MKNIISLIDTNVIINFITKRDDPYKDACFEVIKLCAENVLDGYIAFHSLSTIWYVIRKQETEENAEYIVTCNIKDFKNAKTSVVTPDVFVKIIMEKGIKSV